MVQGEAGQEADDICAVNSAQKKKKKKKKIHLMDHREYVRMLILLSQRSLY